MPIYRHAVQFFNNLWGNTDMVPKADLLKPASSGAKGYGVGRRTESAGIFAGDIILEISIFNGKIVCLGFNHIAD